MADELWAVHIVGSDDYHAAHSLLNARRQAHKFNERIVRDLDFRPTDANVWAVPALWPWSAADHSIDIVKRGK